MKTTTLPEVSQEELHVLLAGLDELPAKFSRELHRKITEHVETVIARHRVDEKVRAAKTETALKEYEKKYSKEPDFEYDANKTPASQPDPMFAEVPDAKQIAQATIKARCEESEAKYREWLKHQESIRRNLRDMMDTQNYQSMVADPRD